MKRYLKSPESKFLDKFEIGKYNTHDDVDSVVEWLEANGKKENLDFYMRCLGTKYKGKFMTKKDGELVKDERVPDTWIAAAHNAEFTRNYKWAAESLPGKAAADEFGTLIARHYINNPEEYSRSSALRLMDGLYVDRRIKDVRNDIERVRRNYGAPLNYLLVNYDGVETIMQNVADRIARRETTGASGESKGIYRKIREGSLRIDGDNIDAVRLAVDNQLNGQERRMIEEMRFHERGESMSDSYRRDIIRFYLLAKGNELFGGKTR